MCVYVYTMIYTHHTTDRICILTEKICIYVCIDTYLYLYRYLDIYTDIDI